MAAPRVPPTRTWNTPVKRGCPSPGRSLLSWQATSRNGARSSRATRTSSAASLTQSTVLSIPDGIERAAQVGPQRGPFRNQLLVRWQLRLLLHLTVHLAALCQQCLLHCRLRPLQSRFHLPRWNAVGCAGCSYATTSTCAGCVCGRKRW